MNNFYLRYLTNSNPFRVISNILRNYKKSCENFFRKDRIKRNQSEPLVAQQRTNNEVIHPCGRKPKSEVNLPTASKNVCSSTIEDWSNSRFNDNSSQESLKVTWSNSQFRSPSNISLTQKSSCLDLNIQKKLNQMPVPNFDDDDVYKPKMSLKRACPWQNFNLADVRKSKYEKFRSVASLTDEMIRKSILRKNRVKSSGALKEVKFNKLASMVVYPKNDCNVMRQARINLSTNINSGGDKPARKRKIKDVSVLSDCAKLGSMNKLGRPPIYYRKHLRNKDKKFPPTEEDLWYFNKKQKIC